MAEWNARVGMEVVDSCAPTKTQPVVVEQTARADCRDLSAFPWNNDTQLLCGADSSKCFRCGGRGVRCEDGHAEEQ